MYDQNLDPDIRSLRQTIVYGLKGISAYGHQARELGYYDDQVDNFYVRALEATTDDSLSVEELIRWTMRTGDMSVAVMKKLDEANTTVYENPKPHKVNVHIKKGQFIIAVSYTHLAVYKRQEYNNIEVDISLLRNKLNYVNSNTDIKTVRGVGYKLDEN